MRVMQVIDSQYLYSAIALVTKAATIRKGKAFSLSPNGSLTL